MTNKFEELPLFKEAHPLVLSIYKLTNRFPPDEKFGLTSQLRRSASSIAANIIEGNSRGHEKTFLEFLYYAKGSLDETRYHLLLARDLDYISLEEYNDVLARTNLVGRQLNGLIKYLKDKNKS